MEKKYTRTLDNRHIDERNLVIFCLVFNGKTYKAAGAVFNLSCERTRQICGKMHRLIKRYYPVYLEMYKPDEMRIKEIRNNKDALTSIVENQMGIAIHFLLEANPANYKIYPKTRRKKL